MNANPTYQEWELLVRCWKLGAACLALIVAILSMQLGRTWAALVEARAGDGNRTLTLRLESSRRPSLPPPVAVTDYIEAGE